jgi:hypothetical protein
LFCTVYRSQKSIPEGYCLNVFYKHCHNHLLKAADAQRLLRPSPELTDKFISLFKNNHSPSSALDSHKFDLQMEHGDNYFHAAANGSLCPSLSWCYKLYYKHFKAKYGESNGAAMVDDLNKFVDKYNAECGDICAKVQYDPSETCTSSDLVVALCSPLMKRVHGQLRSSEEVVFVDSSGTMDRHNTRIFIFLAPSVAGALPLGIVMTYSESEEALTKGFNLLKSILPDNAFHGKGGPAIFMTDNSAPLRNALKATFTHATLLLCTFHTLQAVWRYLWDSHHKVVKNDRPLLMNYFKDILYSKDKEEFQTSFELFLNCSLLEKYTIVKMYMEGLLKSAEDWALCFRHGMLTRDHNTNNYAEAFFRILKDKIFQRLKAYNIVQTFDFLVTRFQCYLERRINDILSNRSSNVTCSRYCIDIKKTEDLKCNEIGTNTFAVKNLTKNTEYLVYTDIERCTCPEGENGAPCKHQYAVHLKFKKSSTQFIPRADSELKVQLHVMLYNVAPPPMWYNTLRGETTHVDKDTSGDESERVVEHAPPEEAPESCNVENEQSAEDLYEGLLKFAADMKENLEKRGDVYIPAVGDFLKNYQSINSESSVVSALHSFNKSRDPGTPRRRSTIPVNSTSIARRSTYLGGRNTQFTGRPSNDFNRTPSQKRAADPTWARVPAKQGKHSLSLSITENRSLPKNHSKK